MLRYLLHGTVLLLQKQALPKLKPKRSSRATKSSRGNHSGSPDRVKSVLELLSCRAEIKVEKWNNKILLKGQEPEQFNHASVEKNQNGLKKCTLSTKKYGNLTIKAQKWTKNRTLQISNIFKHALATCI